MRLDALPSSAVSDSAIVAKAAVRAADRLNIPNKVFARILGVSEASVSRLRKGEYPLEKNQKPFELAVLFVRLYRSLDALVGGDDAVASSWLVNKNVAFHSSPIEMIQRVSGLADVIQYLDARRAIV